MKKFLLLSFSVFMALGLNAQWSRTNVSVTPNVVIADLCEHNGNLYAAVFDSGLVKFNNTLQQWEKVPTSLPPSTNMAHIAHLASSGTNLYAYLVDQTCSSTTIYKSTDNGATFVTDSVGHPRATFPPNCAGQPLNVASVFVLNGKLINVINGGFYSKNPNDPAWIKTTDPTVTFSELFGEFSNTWYAWADNYKLHTSIDNGQTWATPTNTGLPTMFLAKVMNVNPTTGRIYIAGSSLTTSEYRLLYSDNEGVSWDSLPFNQFLGTDWIGQKQKMLGMISKGDDITAMLVNNAINTHPDVIRSTDGGQTFSVDTVGLQPNAFGTVLPAGMLYYSGKLFLAPNYHDIYTQGAGITSVDAIDAIHFQVYPNPVSDILHITSEIQIESVTVSNILGEVFIRDIPSDKSHSLDLNGLANGLYFVTITGNNQKQTLKVVKN